MTGVKRLKRTKIVATLGPASETKEVITKLIIAGADVFRFNMKYNSQKWHADTIKVVRQLGGGVMVDIPSNDFKLDLNDFDYLALSYLKSKKDIVDLRRRFLKRDNEEIRIVAKIENRQALNNLESIIDEADAIMVARGDLALSIDYSELAYFQKSIIDKCREHKKPVIVATEMLMSMTHSLTPTRAEATDVANAVFDGADCLMLSQETTIGEYPVETVATMSKIIDYSENTNELRKIDIPIVSLGDEIIKASVEIANSHKKELKAIVVFTKSGQTAKAISTYRLKIPIIAISDSDKVMSNLKLSYGVIPFYETFNKSKFDNNSMFFGKLAKVFGWKMGDNVIMIHGSNWLETGSVNTLSIKTIGV